MIEISVIIPMYNSSHSIERCLDSVLSQTYKTSYQIIVINDGSTDDSAFVVERYIQCNKTINIRLINKTNGGVASARNEGLKVAQGKWIALLDSDDEWLPDKIASQMAILCANPTIDLLGSNVTSKRIAILGKIKTKVSPVKIWELFISWYPWTPTLIFKREVLNDVGYYDEKLSHAEDAHFLLRICMQKSAWFMPEALVAIGGGKHTFGESGLSADLKAMHEGSVYVINYAYNQGIINRLQYYIFTLYENLKYNRRRFLTWRRK